jgi:hypothetical protein
MRETGGKKERERETEREYRGDTTAANARLKQREGPG